jgi:hypothetical protein
MNKFFMGLLFCGLTGCQNYGNYNAASDRYYRHPDRIACPIGHFAYCEGRQRSTMTCVCLPWQEHRSVLEQLAR